MNEKVASGGQADLDKSHADLLDALVRLEGICRYAKSEEYTLAIQWDVRIKAVQSAINQAREVVKHAPQQDFYLVGELECHVCHMRFKEESELNEHIHRRGHKLDAMEYAPFLWSEKEQKVLSELATKWEMTEHRVLLKGLRIVQAIDGGFMELKDIHPELKMVLIPEPEHAPLQQSVYEECAQIAEHFYSKEGYGEQIAKAIREADASRVPESDKKEHK